MTMLYNTGTRTHFEVNMNVEYKVIDNFLNKHDLKKFESLILMKFCGKSI